jgi:hypothetical protein
MPNRFARFAAIMVAVLTVASITFGVAAAASSNKGGKGGPSTSTISIKKQVPLALGKGSSVIGATVTVAYSCFPGPGGKGGYGGYGGSSNFGSITVGDLAGNFASGFFLPTCDDSRHTLGVPVFGTLIAGDAAANAFVCGFDCAFTSTEVHLTL